MAGATHRAGDPADLAARGGARAMDEPGSHPATRGRRGRPSADRTLQRTAAATPAPTVDRSPADRQSVASGTSVSVRVDLGGRRLLQQNKHQHTAKQTGPWENTQ